MRNTIAVFKLFPNYQIQNSRIIGLPGGTGGIFDVNVNFEVHDVIENFAVDAAGNVFSRYYVICGSMTQPGSTMNTGMVAIVDAGSLSVLDIREYPDAEVFYSVYTAGNYYYVCGKTPATAAGVSNGIVLRDEITQPAAPLPVAYITQQPWEYHKVKVNNNGNDLVVSGTDYNEIGFTAFDIAYLKITTAIFTLITLIITNITTLYVIITTTLFTSNVLHINFFFLQR